MSNARKRYTKQSAVGSVTSDMHTPRHTCKLWMNGFADESACVYGKAGNSRELAFAILSNAEYLNGEPINGVMLVRDIGQWQVVE